MANIQKRENSDGSTGYRVRIRMAGMPLLTKTFPTYKEAKIWAQRKEAEIREGRYFPKQDDKEKTFGNLIERYIKKELIKKPKSYQKQKNQLSWWNKHLGKYFLCHITPSMIAELRDRLLSEKTGRGRLRTASTTNRYLAILSLVFNVAVKEWYWLKENPVLKITRSKENKARERYLSKDEITLLLNECRKCMRSPYLYSIVLFALATGARRGEIVNLKWDDVDFVRAVATFRDTKNGETRAVPLSKVMIECLKRECDHRLVASQYVFPSKDGKSPADIRTAWDNVIAKTGLKRVCFHSLRHTAASHLAMRGVSTLEIAAILGHKTLAMVKRYSHFSTSSTAQALTRMNEELLQECVNG